MNYTTVNAIVDTYSEFAVKTRRDLHKHAETAWKEFRTTAKIAEILEENNINFVLGKAVINPEFTMDYPPADVIKENEDRAIAQGANPKYIEMMEGYTGAIAIINTGRPGPVTALRFDIDANDVSETTLETHRPNQCNFSSINLNSMHACGHDGHATIGLITAMTLNQIKDSLCGTIKIIFQPAEEGVRGALSIVKNGVLDDVEFFLSSHIGFGGKEGQIATNTGGYLATTKLNAHFTGVSSHAGAAPESGKNAILAACAATLAAHTHCQDGRGSSRVNIGKITGGSGRNVIADSATIQIETRGSNTIINEELLAKVTATLNGAALMYGCSLATEVVGGAAGAECTPELSHICDEVIEEAVGIVTIKEKVLLGGSEDVSYMMEKVQSNGGKAVYMFLGTKTMAPAHNSLFDFGEDVLVLGGKVFANAVLKINKNI